jgi:hypothetical protein
MSDIIMKKIQTQLIKPFVEKMEREWQSLYDKVRESKVPEALELCPVVKNQLEKLQQLRSQSTDGENSKENSTDSVHHFIRQSKMDLRSAERRWQRYLVSTERVKTRLANHSAKFSKSLPPENS